MLERQVCGFGETGDPMVRTEQGQVLFVKKTGVKPKRGQVIKVRVMKRLEKFGFAELV